MRPLKKGTKVFVAGDWDVGIPDYEGRVIKYIGKNYYLIEDKFCTFREEVKRKKIKTIKDLKDLERGYSEIL